MSEQSKEVEYGAALEPSTNTHHMDAKIVERENLDNPVGTMKLKIEGDGLVTHGEHGTVKTESPNVIKVNQQEVNPVQQKLQPAFD